jgi:nitrite reductase (NADH) small subunit
MQRHRIGRDGDFEEGCRRVVAVGGAEVGVFRLDGRLHAWRNLCPHQGGPVCQGRIFRRVVDDIDAAGGVHGRRYHETDRHIVCPWHGAEFDIRTGRHAGTDRLRLTPVMTEVADGEVYLHVD